MRRQNNSGNVASDGAASSTERPNDVMPRRRHKNGGHEYNETQPRNATIGSAIAQLKPTDMEPIHQSQNADAIVGVDPAISSMKPIRDLRDHQFKLSVVH
jgi:hypothetical protein